MPGRPPRRDAAVLLAALRRLMAARHLSQLEIAKAVGISTSTLCRGLSSDRLSNDVRGRLLHHFPELDAAAPGAALLAESGDEQESLRQILHLLHETDSLLGDIKSRVVSLADVTQART